jgi:hypothetical protein
MRRWAILVGTLVAGVVVGGCFSDDNGGPRDAALPDTYFAYDSSVPDTGSALDSTMPDAGIDVAPEASMDSPEEPVVEAGADVEMEAAPEAGQDATVDATVGPDASGCAKATDCPPNFACDTSTGQCVTACGGTTETACNGGCCATGRCATGIANGVCGNNGAACGACANGTPTCSAGGACTTACGQTGDGTCGGGTCCQNNACVAQGPTACGPSCLTCVGNLVGLACVNGACGCKTVADCPMGYACDTLTNKCTLACASSVDTACNGGCCDPTSGTCVPGTTNAACGNGGGMCNPCTSGSGCCDSTGTCQPPNLPTGCGPNCLNCTNNNAGHICYVGRTCGCNVPTDCPVGYACNTNAHQCTTSCVGGYTCNGGCCHPIPATFPVAVCVAGTAANACGLNGGACTDCTPNLMTCNANGMCQ